MTNREAIAILTHNWKYRELIDNSYQYEALELAIKALHTVEIIEDELGPEYEETAIWFDVPHFEEIQERAEKRTIREEAKNDI